MKDDFGSLFAFNRWANARMLDACRKLTPESRGCYIQEDFGPINVRQGVRCSCRSRRSLARLPAEQLRKSHAELLLV